MRPFKVTEEKYNELMEKFSAYLKSVSMTENKISFNETVTDVKNKNKVLIVFEMKAYIKMRDIVDRYPAEAGWFGFIDKISNLEYRVTDICVYPQIYTGVTVKETNDPWDDDMPMEQIRRRHFHGHSHVNMDTHPSGKDMSHRDDQLALVKKDSFFVFMITNKRCEWTAAVYDLANNMVYNTEDILIDVDLGNGEMLSDFVEDAKKMIKPSTPAAERKIMQERYGEQCGNTNLSYGGNFTPSYGQNAWLPKTAPKSVLTTNTKKPENKKTKKTKKEKTYSGKKIPSQLGLFDSSIDEEFEDLLSEQDGYIDESLGLVSDTPSVCNKEILRMMR